MNGLTLSELFYVEAARPILESHFPEILYSAALIGWSSEVLGYDNVASMDHNWGPRFQLFLSTPDYEKYKSTISASFSQNLPLEFRGYPTNFGASAQGDQLVMKRVEVGPVHHMIQFETVESFFGWYLGANPNGEITKAEWLTFSEHKLLAVTGGKVFHDDLGLDVVRQKFSYYPRLIWLYATRLLERGVHHYVISALLGHATPMTGFGAASRMTPGYAHATWDMMVTAVAMLEQPLGINESKLEP
jgi:Domain of unknown function (DUF4037)